MSGLNYLKLGSTLSNICNTTQLDNATKCHHAFKNFWGEPWTVRVICPWIRKFAIFDFVYTLASANIDQSVLATIHLPTRSRMSLIMEQVKPEHPGLYALEFGWIAETDFVYTLASPSINQSAPNLVKMYVTIRSRMSSIMDLIEAELSD